LRGRSPNCTHMVSVAALPSPSLRSFLMSDYSVRPCIVALTGDDTLFNRTPIFTKCTTKRSEMLWWFSLFGRKFTYMHPTSIPSFGTSRWTTAWLMDDVRITHFLTLLTSKHESPYTRRRHPQMIWPELFLTRYLFPALQRK